MAGFGAAVLAAVLARPMPAIVVLGGVAVVLFTGVLTGVFADALAGVLAGVLALAFTAGFTPLLAVLPAPVLAAVLAAGLGDALEEPAGDFALTTIIRLVLSLLLLFLF